MPKQGPTVVSSRSCAPTSRLARSPAPARHRESTARQHRRRLVSADRGANAAQAAYLRRPERAAGVAGPIGRPHDDSSAYSAGAVAPFAWVLLLRLVGTCARSQDGTRVVVLPASPHGQPRPSARSWEGARRVVTPRGRRRVPAARGCCRGGQRRRLANSTESTTAWTSARTSGAASAEYQASITNRTPSMSRMDSWRCCPCCQEGALHCSPPSGVDQPKSPRHPGSPSAIVKSTRLPAYPAMTRSETSSPGPAPAGHASAMAWRLVTRSPTVGPGTSCGGQSPGPG